VTGFRFPCREKPAASRRSAKAVCEICGLARKAAARLNLIAAGTAGRLTGVVLDKKSNGGIAVSLLLVTLLWGASNVGTKFLVAGWPPIWVGASRFLGAGLLLLAILRWTTWLGRLTPLSVRQSRELWWRTGLSLAVYIVVFNLALQLTSASHVALYLGTSPVWALLWEERPSANWRSAQCYGAAALALAGVVVLFWPSLKSGQARWSGELLGVAASFLWTFYGRQSRRLGSALTGVELSAHTMWRAGALLMPLALVEVVCRGLAWRTDLVLVQIYCLIGGGVVTYVFWNNALRHWTTSRVFLFNNLIPISTMAWAWACLGEPVTATFWLAMFLVAAGVVLGQGGWSRTMAVRWLAPE
jgi:drug/metabolite transporter (DMT)-like permease